MRRGLRRRVAVLLVLSVLAAMLEPGPAFAGGEGNPPSTPSSIASDNTEAEVEDEREEESEPVEESEPANQAPTVDESAYRYEGFTGKQNAPRGVLVQKWFEEIFSDPDGDDLAYSARVSSGRSELVSVVHVRADDRHILFFEADGEDDWSALSPAVPNPALFEVTLTATDPDGASASVTGWFSTHWEQPENRAPVVNTDAEGYERFTGLHNAPPGVVVFKYFDGIFSDPDGDELVYSAQVSAGRDELVSAVQVRVHDGPRAGYRHLLYFEADGEGDWSGLSPGVPNLEQFEVTLTATDPDGASASVTGWFSTHWEQPENRAPVVNTDAEVYERFIGEHLAPPGVLVYKSFAGLFSDPDGDELTFTASIPDDRAGVVERLRVRESGRWLFFQYEDGADWSSASPPLPDPLATEVTLTATDPDGLSASVTGWFEARWNGRPELTAMEGNVSYPAGGGSGTAVVRLVFDRALQTSPAPAPGQFTAKVFSSDPASARTIAVNSVRIQGHEVVLELASPPAPGQFLTVDYTHNEATPIERDGGGSPAAGFSGPFVLMLLAAPAAQPRAQAHAHAHAQVQSVQAQGLGAICSSLRWCYQRTPARSRVLDLAHNTSRLRDQAASPQGRFAVLYSGPSSGAEAAKCPVQTGWGDNVAATWSAHCESVSRPGNRAAYFTYTPIVDEFLYVTLTSPDATQEAFLWEGGRAEPVEPRSSGFISCLHVRCARYRVKPGKTYVIEVTGRGAAAGGRFLLGVRGWTAFLRSENFTPSGPAIPAGCREDLGRIDYSNAELHQMGRSRPNGWPFGTGEADGTFSWPCHSVERSATYARYFTFSIAEPRNLRFDLYSSYAAGAKLILRSGTALAGGPAVGSHNPEGPPRARIDQLLQPGTYTIEAVAPTPGSGGSFDLPIKEGPRRGHHLRSAARSSPSPSRPTCGRAAPTPPLATPGRARAATRAGTPSRSKKKMRPTGSHSARRCCPPTGTRCPPTSTPTCTCAPETSTAASPSPRTTMCGPGRDGKPPPPTGSTTPRSSKRACPPAPTPSRPPPAGPPPEHSRLKSKPGPRSPTVCPTRPPAR